MRLLLSALLLLGLGGCTLGPDYQTPAFKHSEQWHSEQVRDESLSARHEARWWQQFEDPLLTALITRAAQNNRDLAATLANIERVRALRHMAGAAFMPSVNATGEASRSRYSRQTGFGANTGTRNSFSAALDAGWELDLFGRTRRSLEAADAQVEAVEAVRQGLMLSVVAELAANYFELRGLQRQQQVSLHNITLLGEVEEIARAQSELGVTSELDLARARGERENMQATLPNLQAEISARIYRISVLTGEAPEFYADILAAVGAVPVVRDHVPVGLRSDILKRRPDVQQAERELAAATANIGVARADLFPNFSLTGSIGSSARVFSDLFTPATLTRSIGALLDWPLFAGGALHAAVDVAHAEEKAALARYEQRVLLALEDTEAALTRYAREWQTLKQLRTVEISRQQAFEIARLRFEAGEEGFLVILDAERSLIATQSEIVSSETRLLTHLTQLYKTLGGEWQQLDIAEVQPHG